jgi:hypothetical protein
LLSDNDGGHSLLDKSKPSWPEMSLVCFSCALSGDRERLARTAPSPDRPVVGPSGELEGVLPAADACEVVLANSVNWVGDVEDAALVHNRIWESVSAPLCGERIDFVEVDIHSVRTPSCIACAIL